MLRGLDKIHEKDSIRVWAGIYLIYTVIICW
jgi:hypothetical protein